MKHANDNSRVLDFLRRLFHSACIAVVLSSLPLLILIALIGAWSPRGS